MKEYTSSGQNLPPHVTHKDFLMDDDSDHRNKDKISVHGSGNNIVLTKDHSFEIHLPHMDKLLNSHNHKSSYLVPGSHLSTQHSCRDYERPKHGGHSRHSRPESHSLKTEKSSDDSKSKKEHPTPSKKQTTDHLKLSEDQHGKSRRSRSSSHSMRKEEPPSGSKSKKEHSPSSKELGLRNSEQSEDKNGQSLEYRSGNLCSLETEEPCADSEVKKEHLSSPRKHALRDSDKYEEKHGQLRHSKSDRRCSIKTEELSYEKSMKMHTSSKKQSPVKLKVSQDKHVKSRHSRSVSRCSMRSASSSSGVSSRQHSHKESEHHHGSRQTESRHTRSVSHCSARSSQSCAKSESSWERRDNHSQSDGRYKCSSKSRESRHSESTTRYSSGHKRSSSSLQIPASKRHKQNASNERDSMHNKSKDSLVDSSEDTETMRCYENITSEIDESFYVKEENNLNLVRGTEKLAELYKIFQYDLVERSERIKQAQPKYEPPIRKTKLRKPKPPKGDDESSSSSEESSSEEENTAMEELERKKKHPHRLHEELWFNDPGEMNDGPLCRCSAKAKRSGIRHGIYAGETSINLCDKNTNNFGKLHHYRICITPNTNFMSKSPTTIKYQEKDYVFEGFSMFSHFKIRDLPNCRVIRFNIEYTIYYCEEEFPQNFTVEGLELFSKYLFTELLELVDLNWKAHNDSTGCPRFHFMPRFIHICKDKSLLLLPLEVVLQYMIDSNGLLMKAEDLPYIMSLNKHKWQDLADEVKGMIITCPGKKPSSIRVDQLDREACDIEKKIFPEVIHFGVRPPQLSYAGNPNYQKAWRNYVKFRHLLANKPKVAYPDRRKLVHKERRLQEMRMTNNLKRDVTIVISSEKFYKTGIMCDIVQHAMLLPVLVCHLRFHQSLDTLESEIDYKFLDRYLLQLALTHPSYRENFGTNPDHARNSLTNCGIRQPEYGDRKIHYMNTRKRGINTLINIMSRFGKRKETASTINHNERLEFLGDAVVEFLSSIHLFYMFPNLEEGGLATYRAAIVQNQHLAVLAKKLQLEKFMLYAHGSDLCHDLELRHAMANCFEALMGALFLDSGIEVSDRVFSETLFPDPDLLDVWVNCPPHPLQAQEPGGDRKWIDTVPVLQNLHEFELATGIEFTHIRLLARALTHRSLGYNNLTLGSNQRLEFLGDTVLQLVASEYLYKHFPEHHEGHLSLLRSSLVNNRTQAVVCDDLGMVQYAIYPYSKVELKAKDRADLLEAFLGALYVDKDLEWCTKFCEVCFFPRLQHFIMNQEWNDPKSKLQQCCLTLRTMDGGEPDIPVYKVIECKGPTNTRVYAVAVYFQGKRLAVGSGHSIQQSEMAAAQNALNSSKDLFPQLGHQRRAIEKSLRHGVPPSKSLC